MRRATDRWIVLALLGITIWGWTQSVRLLVHGEPWFFVLPIAVGAVLVTIAEANLLRLWWWWRRREENKGG